MAVILHVTIVPTGAGGVQLSPWGDYISPGRISYPEGTVVTLTAIPFIGYFDHWEGDASGTAISTTITMDSDKEVTAVFAIPEEVPTYQLTTAVVGNGRVDPNSGVFNKGDQIILAATPDEGNLFDYWSGDIVGTTPTPGMPNNLLVIMDRDRYIIAHFVEEVAPPPPPPPEYAGTISRKELEYNESRGAIPVSDVPQCLRGLVHIWGRNDMSTNQKLGIYWFVADPEGYVAQEYGPAWEMFSTGPGSEHEFIAGRFDLSKVGKYTMWVELLMNRDDPQVVAQYIGELCTVAAVVPEPTFAGFGITEYTKL
ncbi:hypothetical protein ES703_44225 [subsurface metagenome]